MLPVEPAISLASHTCYIIVLHSIQVYTYMCNAMCVHIHVQRHVCTHTCAMPCVYTYMCNATSVHIHVQCHGSSLLDLLHYRPATLKTSNTTDIWCNGVASISTLLQMIGLFSRIYSLL